MDNETVRDKNKGEKKGRRGKRKADVVRPGILYQIADAVITIAGLALIGAILMYIFMIFG